MPNVTISFAVAVIGVADRWHTIPGLADIMDKQREQLT